MNRAAHVWPLSACDPHNESRITNRAAWNSSRFTPEILNVRAANLRKTLGTGFVAPALPSHTLIFAYRVILEHAAHERGHVGFVSALALLKLPLVPRRKYWRFGETMPLHEAVSLTRRALRYAERMAASTGQRQRSVGWSIDHN